MLSETGKIKLQAGLAQIDAYFQKGRYNILGDGLVAIGTGVYLSSVTYFCSGKIQENNNKYEVPTILAMMAGVSLACIGCLLLKTVQAINKKNQALLNASSQPPILQSDSFSNLSMKEKQKTLFKKIRNCLHKIEQNNMKISMFGQMIEEYKIKIKKLDLENASLKKDQEQLQKAFDQLSLAGQEQMEEYRELQQIRQELKELNEVHSISSNVKLLPPNIINHIE
jgi:hypothetical protein